MKTTIVNLVFVVVSTMHGAAVVPENPAGAEDIGLKIISPLPDERFIVGETVHFKAEISHFHGDRSQIVWTSDASGALGQGAQLEINSLTRGNHKITASIAGQTQEIT